MHDYLISLILGIVEGLTEFLPVSSTAHLRIAQGLLGIDLEDGFWKTYSVIIQLGAILSVVVYFRSRIAEFVRSFPRGRQGDRTVWTHPLSLTLLAFAITAGPAFLLDETIGENLESLVVIGLALVIGGVVMWVIDARARNPRTLDMEQMTFAQAIWIGAAQILSAAFPGTSRSMATIAAGQLAGLSRTAALEFSFFLSIPVMFAATGFKLLQLLTGRGDSAAAPVDMDTHKWIVLAIGFVTSFIVALAVIHWFMAWVRTRGFTPFAIYRIVVGAAVLAWAFRAG